MDPARRRVERSGREVTLTPREFGLLEFLMRHRGDVVSKTGSSRACGMPTTTVIRTWSRSTWATCGERWLSGRLRGRPEALLNEQHAVPA